MIDSYTRFCYYLSRAKGLASDEWAAMPTKKRIEMIEEAKKLVDRMRLEISWSRGRGDDE
jgi:hypothetical protein